MAQILTVISLFIFVIVGHWTYVSMKKNIPFFESDGQKLLYHTKLIAFFAVLAGFFYFFLYSFFAKWCRDGMIDNDWWLDGFYAGYSLVLFYGCFFIYLSIYYMIDRSVSSKMMIEIDKSANKKMTYNDLIAVYDVEKKYQEALDDLVYGGLIKKTDDKYYCTYKGAIIARLASLFKKGLKLGRGG
ncbi:MAG: hypothetical protein PHV17_02150 [Candidatus Omnitrophica bacterium]|nr:hypothetical protein [Candidatus Omnitrophota bacterium]